MYLTLMLLVITRALLRRKESVFLKHDSWTIRGPTRTKMTGILRKLHSEELSNVRQILIKVLMMRWRRRLYSAKGNE
jgi:hypothetical protein